MAKTHTRFRTMYFICVFFFVGVTSVTCDSGKLPPEVYSYNLEDAEVHFKEFIKSFNKNYGAEYEYRFGVFKENLKKINHWNAEENFNVHGITQFSDMTEGEFQEFAGFFKPELTNLTDSDVVYIDSSRHDINYSASLDYRNYNMVTAVKDQGDCSCCYIFSAVGHIEGLYAKKYGKLLSFSVKEVLDCMDVGGCKGGHPYEVMQRTADFGGLVLDRDYPYSPVQSTCCYVDKSRIVARVAEVNTLQAGENALIGHLNEYGPLPVAIRASVKMQHFRGGKVFYDPQCMLSQNDHVVLLIGYGTAPDGPYWQIKNSWGTSWGEQGYFRMARGMGKVGMCGIGEYGPATATII